MKAIFSNYPGGVVRIIKSDNEPGVWIAFNDDNLIIDIYNLSPEQLQTLVRVTNKILEEE